MSRRPRVATATSPGWNLLDALGFVAGAAVASVHVKDRAVFADELSPPFLVILFLGFILVAVTAAGPFLFCLRRFGNRRPAFASETELAWVALGLPWTLMAIWRSLPSGELLEQARDRSDVFLQVGLLLASAHAARIFLRRLLAAESKQADPVDASRSVAERISIGLVDTCPLQPLFALMLGSRP
ncbi:MAG: hypothetical protein SFX72_18285 [Isosphaeraceae bacterium]|nr:hypothetical protein [Isosphaeraceae bacterium]